MAFHRLSLGCGHVEYTELDRILKDLRFDTIYVKGVQNTKIINEILLYYVPHGNRGNHAIRVVIMISIETMVI